jgi:hypothetical protein
VPATTADYLLTFRKNDKKKLPDPQITEYTDIHLLNNMAP